MPKLKDYRDLDRLFLTDEVVSQDVNMQTEGGLITIKLPCKKRQATYGELLDLYKEHIQNKPKRFLWYIIPNLFYSSIELIHWEYNEKKLKRLIDIGRPFPLDGFICWYE